MTSHTKIRPPYPRPVELYQAKENIQYYRKISGITQADIARALKVQSPSVNRWESSFTTTKVPVQRVDKLAAILNADPHALTIEHDRYDDFKKYDTPDALVSYSTGCAASLVSIPQTIEDYKNNIRYFRLKAGISQKGLAEILGMSQNAVSIWESADNVVMPYKTIRNRVAAALNAPPNLLFPKDPELASMHFAARESAFSVENKEFDNSSNVVKIGMLGAKDSFLSMSSNTCAAAGIEFPLEMQAETTVSEMIGVHLGNGMAVAKISGDSMFNPNTGAGIPDGSVVLIDTSKRDVEQALDKVVCYTINGCFMVKRLKRSNGILVASSDNPRYFPIFYSGEDQVELIGEVVRVISVVE